MEQKVKMIRNPWLKIIINRFKYITPISVYKYHNIEKFESISLESKYSFLFSISNYLDKLNRLEPQEKRKK